jgi:hypothetical protein
LKKEHLRVFAIAYRYQLRDAALLAMKESLRHPLLDDAVSELQDIPASGYHQYLSYRKLCSESIAKVIRGDGDSTAWNIFPWDSFRQCNCPSVTRGGCTFKQWLFEFEQRATISLSARATPETVTDLKYLKESLTKASACPSCSRVALQHFPNFALGLVSRLQTAIYQVSTLKRLEFPCQCGLTPGQVPLTLEF